jgi:hypothetical protein
MPGRTHRRVVWSAALLSLAAVASVAIVAVSNADPGPKSHELHGKMRNIIQHTPCSASPVDFCSTFDASGEINGEGLVVVDTLPQRTDFGYSEAHTVITTKKGELHCHEAALFSRPSPPPELISSFVDMCLIDGGTGIYDGAKGHIQEVGTFDFGAGVGELDYYGKITYS